MRKALTKVINIFPREGSLTDYPILEVMETKDKSCD